MSIYLVSSIADAEFTEKLSTDLSDRGIEHATTQMNTDERFSALHKADQVIFVLSQDAVEDPRVLTTINAAAEIRKNMLTVRISPIAEIPKHLRGILPLDFSNPDLYDESLETLLEDLSVTTPIMPVTRGLPEDVQQSLNNLTVADQDQRRELVKRLGNFRESGDNDEREAAKDALSMIAFRDQDPRIKQLAGATLQSFDKPRETKVELEAPKPNEIIASVEKSVKMSNKSRRSSSSAPVPVVAQYVWASTSWRIFLPGVGVLMALISIAMLNNWALGLALGVTYGILTWFNIQIRDGGNLMWEMPGPLIGNALGGFVISLIFAAVGRIIETETLLGVLGIAIIGGLNGFLIGWLSMLKQ